MHRHILALYMYYVNARLFPARCNDEDDESTMFMHVRAYMYVVCSYFIAVPYTCDCICTCGLVQCMPCIIITCTCMLEVVHLSVIGI